MKTRILNGFYFIMIAAAVMSLPILLTSCSDDDGDGMPAEEWLVGYWEGDHHVTYYEQDGKTVKSEVHYDVVLSLNEDGSIGGTAFKKNRWRLEGNKFYVDNIGYDFVRLNGNSFRLTSTVEGKYPAINSFTFTRIKE